MSERSLARSTKLDWPRFPVKWVYRRYFAWPEYSFVGDTYAGFLEPGLHVGFRVADASAWVFAGTGLRGNSGCHPGDICESAMVQRITANILRLFGQGPAARHQPSVPNWRQVTSQ